MNPARTKAPIVDCPACGRKVAFEPANRWRPFCSERCRTVDLGAWASGAYVVSAGASEETGREDGLDPDGPPPGMLD
jgi:endogenous inhibitor of DNA gyrase (YacG/DUF329 family)